MTGGTKIFQQNRALGYVSNHVPANVRFITRRKENLIVTCVGRSFHVYACNTFRLITVSGLHEDDITCLSSDKYYVYSACGNTIYCWKMGRFIKRSLRGGSNKNIHLMLPFGEHLISIDENSLMQIWDVENETTYAEIPFNNKQFKLTALMHPATYINKILVGSEQGGLQLWNIRGSRLVFNFETFESPVCVLEQAPALDVVGIGLKNGKILLMNLKSGVKLMEFSQDWGAVMGISFRTDGHSIMTTASPTGHVMLWDLDEKRIVSQLKTHERAVTTLQCLSSEPLMLTTSPDNSMKMWIFDMPDGGARLLRERQGHEAPPTFIRFHGSNGQSIVSAGEDSSLRVFSTLSENLNKSLGRASYNRKKSKKKNRFEADSARMPCITKFTTETTREKEWDNIAALHSGLVMATTWSFHKQRMGDLKLIPPQFQNKNPNKIFHAEATSICLTHCGNFVIIGYSSGDVERFNIQSGIHRMTYGSPAHRKSAVRGLATDILNQFVVTGAIDGLIKFWNFVLKKDDPPFDTVDMKAGIEMFVPHQESSMLCIALDDFSVNVLDLDTRQIIRRFKGHTAQITDACFSPDSRWLITAAMDCSIKVWDIPSSYLIDHFKMENPCRSLTMSPTGKFLATTHSNDLGIYLWSNKSLFSHISLRAINPESEPPTVDLPQTAIVVETTDSVADDLNAIKLEEGEELDMKYETPDQLDNILVTMSKEAISKWQNILNLDTIKKRNRPKEPLRAPKQAPFFLPTVTGTELRFDVSDTVGKRESMSKLIIPSKIDNTTKFGKLLRADDYPACVKHLCDQGPSMIDFEIKSLSPYGSGSIDIMESFIKMLLYMFESNGNFELAQSYLGLLLKTHSDEICKSPKLRRYLDDLEVAQQRGWKVLEDNLLYGIGVVNVIRNYAH